MDIRDTSTLVRPLPPHQPGAHTLQVVIYNTPSTLSTPLPQASRRTACARTHATAAWGATQRSAIVFGLPSAPRLGGKT